MTTTALAVGVLASVGTPALRRRKSGDLVRARVHLRTVAEEAEQDGWLSGR
jgi:hypothetical protein